MVARRASLASQLGILDRVSCPHCWHRFPAEKILWISQHSDLIGDDKLGAEEQQRFLPTRFTVAGDAVDARGFHTQLLACPNCHLQIPRPLLEMEPLFLSIFGAPGSGKSFYLAAMTWELRKQLPLKFGVSFADADPVFNHKLNEHEQQLFVNDQSSEALPMNRLILKTDAEAGRDFYNQVKFGTHAITYLRPFLFNMRPEPSHPNRDRAGQLSRVVCLYDNAGEDFQPGMDSAGRAVTRHLAQSGVLMFLFDPTQDVRWRQHCKPVGRHRASGPETMRQEPILQEAAARVRRYAGLRSNEKHRRPLIVIVTKYDSWSHLLNDGETFEPWRTVRNPKAGAGDAQIHALDLPKVERRSALTRALLLQLAPEIVTAAEGFCEEVLYVPVSAVGWRVQVGPDRQELLRPSDADPHWVTVPYLYALCRANPGLIPMIKSKSGEMPRPL